jgi:hypothetical protein
MKNQSVVGYNTVGSVVKLANSTSAIARKIETGSHRSVTAQLDTKTSHGSGWKVRSLQNHGTKSHGREESSALLKLELEDCGRRSEDDGEDMENRCRFWKEIMCTIILESHY